MFNSIKTVWTALTLENWKANIAEGEEIAYHYVTGFQRQQNPESGIEQGQEMLI